MRKKWAPLIEQVTWWGTVISGILIPMGLAALPLLWATVTRQSPNLQFLLMMVFVLFGVGGSFYTLEWHWGWHLRRAQRKFELERTNKMAREMTVDQLVQEALAGRFPYKDDKPWDRT